MLYDSGEVLTIPGDSESTVHEAEALALSALGWVLTDEERAQRLLSLTGLTPEVLREGLGDTAVLGAVLDFLANHEPDLVLAADALDVKPERLAEAARVLTR